MTTYQNNYYIDGKKSNLEILQYNKAAWTRISWNLYPKASTYIHNVMVLDKFDEWLGLGMPGGGRKVGDQKMQL